MRFPFAKYAGCGNDFIIIDDRALQFPCGDKLQIQKICQRKFGVGADGLILLQTGGNADFRMRIFNSDGGEAEMCGNGIRCLMKFIAERVGPAQPCTIATLAGLVTMSIVDDKVVVELAPPAAMEWNLEIDLAKRYRVHFLNTGVPHVVLFVDDHLASFDIAGVGRQFRQHPYFAPAGTNFNASFIAENGMVWNRTYERGVEEETLACGTGCIAAAIAAHKIKGLKSPIKVMTLSKEILDIAFELQGSDITNLTMTGSAGKVFEGSLLL